MRLPVLSLLLTVWAGTPLPAHAAAVRAALDERTLMDTVFVRPLYGLYRHCGGACLKSGSLTWYCFQKQSCYLSCATAPTLMKYAVP